MVAPTGHPNTKISLIASALGATGDQNISSNGGFAYKYLNRPNNTLSVDPIIGTFQIYNEDRQVRPFLFTTYRTLSPTFPLPDTPARGSGSAVSISQSDGTPFATLRMYQNQTPSTIEEIYGNA